MSETPSMIQLTIALNGLGMLLKNNPKVPNDWIPTVLCLVGAALYPLLEGSWDVWNIVNGFVAALAAVGAHQTVTKFKNGKTNETTLLSPPPAGSPAGGP